MRYLRESRLIKGSIQEKRLPCGTAGCHCHKKGGVGHGPYTYLAVVVGGKTRSFLLRKADIATAKRYVQRYRELREEVEKVTRQNVRILRQRELG